MYEFYKKYNTKNITPGINTMEYIIIHHTATKENSIDGVIKTLTTGSVSCHFVIDEKGKSYKIGEPKNILRHCGISKWKEKKNMNNYSLGIEVIGPLKDGGFSIESEKELINIIKYLMNAINIPIDNVLRHKDISPGRKIDISDTLWNKKHKTFDEWKKKNLL